MRVKGERGLHVSVIFNMKINTTLYQLKPVLLCDYSDPFL